MLGGPFESHGLSGHWKYTNVIWRIINCHLFTLYLLVSSINNFCKQFESRSGATIP